MCYTITNFFRSITLQQPRPLHLESVEYLVYAVSQYHVNYLIDEALVCGNGSNTVLYNFSHLIAGHKIYTRFMFSLD